MNLESAFYSKPAVYHAFGMGTQEIQVPRKYCYPCNNSNLPTIIQEEQSNPNGWLWLFFFCLVFACWCAICTKKPYFIGGMVIAGVGMIMVLFNQTKRDTLTITGGKQIRATATTNPLEAWKI